jgi:hypothetical protein
MKLRGTTARRNAAVTAYSMGASGKGGLTMAPAPTNSRCGHNTTGSTHLGA